MSAVRPHILLVDDDDAIRSALRELLEDEGHAVVDVPDGAAALEHLRSGAKVCLILLDMNMPVLDGWAFLEARRNDPAIASIPVVIVSATAGPSRFAPYAAVAAIVAKPFSPDAIVRVVSEYAA